MKVIMEPQVYLIGKQIIVQEELDRFLSDENVVWKSDSEVAGEVVVEVGGRLCYMSFAKPRPGGNKAYVEHIKEVQHGSVLEHAVWTLVVTGVSRSLTHDLVRHRAGVSPSMLSQRYCDESVAEYVGPPDLQDEIAVALKVEKEEGGIDWMLNGHEPGWLTDYIRENNIPDADTFWKMVEAGADWLESVRRSHDSYVKLADYLNDKAIKRGLVKTEGRKFARQAARSVLPNATETKIQLTCNARALRNICEQRASRFADPEIRVLAGKIWEVVVKDAPNIFGDYTKVELPDETFELNTPYRKV